VAEQKSRRESEQSLVRGQYGTGMLQDCEFSLFFPARPVFFGHRDNFHISKNPFCAML
jgi:hypothetical protein